MRRAGSSLVERMGGRLIRLASCVLGVYLIGISAYRFVLERYVSGAPFGVLAGIGIQISLCGLGALFLLWLRAANNPRPCLRTPFVHKGLWMTAYVLGAYLISVLAYRLVLSLLSNQTALLNLLAGLGFQGGACVLGAFMLLGLRAAAAPKKQRHELSAGAYRWIAVGAAVALRAILIPLIHVAPTSDFNMYIVMANGYAASGEYWATDYVLLAAPNILPFVVTLGELFKIFGSSILVAQCMNTLLVAGTVSCMHSLASRLMKPRPAFFAALLFAAEPSVLLFTLCVSTEAFYVFPLIWALDLAVRAVRGERWTERLLFALSAGALLCFSGVIRPIAILLLIAFILWIALFVLPKRGRTLARGVCVMIVMLIGFWGTQKGCETLQNDVYKTEQGIRYDWLLYEGSDSVGSGGWGAENAALLRQVIAENPASEARAVMRQKLLERARAFTASEWAEAMVHNGVNVWAYNDYGYAPVLTAVNFERDQSILNVKAIEKPTIVIINALYLVTLAAFAITCLEWARRGEREGTWCEGGIMLLTLAGIALLHSFAACIPRAHYPALPFMCMLMLYVPYAEGVSRHARGYDIAV